MKQKYELPHHDLSILMSPEGYKRVVRLLALLQFKYADELERKFADKRKAKICS